MAVSVDYYGKLETSARMAGIDDRGSYRRHQPDADKVLGAAIRRQHRRIDVPGIPRALTRDDMDKGVGNAEYLAGKLAQGHDSTAGQKAARVRQRPRG